ncbi:gephyrin-like molybdotransferase Glp [Novispirillum sp. DQ9]|uniref:molybdopterin molybdotransferase MoeA n=1 Tax=Novispirillum sp. DQ9 TaxID=3398612 RepID=UPI003C7B3678
MTAMTVDCYTSGGLLPLERARQQIETTFACLCESEAATLGDALGRVLADDVASRIQIPAFDNSAMDGYGIRCADLNGDGPTVLRVQSRIAAGDARCEMLGAGAAVRIFTGAPVPPGVDAVVMQEKCEVRDGTVVVPHGVRPGENVRPAGGDVAVGDVVLRAGTILQAQHIGMAAALGLDRLPVRRRLRVAVLSTGNELREGSGPLPHGCIFDSNRHSVAALLRRFGCQVTDFGIVTDEPDIIQTVLADAAAGHDMVVTSGGMSVGEEDHVKGAVRGLGHLDFWRVALKPGKPVAIGRIRDAVFLGLPGNPVSALVTFLLLGGPLVLRLSGAAVLPLVGYPLPAGFHMRVKGGRREFVRGWTQPDGTGALTTMVVGTQSSGALSSMTGATGLIDLGAAPREVHPGDMVTYIPFSHLLP